MTRVVSLPSGRGDDEYGDHKAGRRRGARKPRRSNPHFMTPAETIKELDGLIRRNAFYDAMRRNEIPHVDFGRLKAVPRDFIPQLKERAMRKLDRSIAHPELTFGLLRPPVVTAAGIAEFGLSFALFWTPLVRRLAAFAFILLLTAATLRAAAWSCRGVGRQAGTRPRDRQW
jgi:hypothetical protein